MFIVELKINTNNIEEYEKAKNIIVEYFFKTGFLVTEKEKGFFEFKSFDEKVGFFNALDIFDNLFYEDWFVKIVESCCFYILKKGKVSFYRDVVAHYFSY